VSPVSRGSLRSLRSTAGRNAAGCTGGGGRNRSFSSSTSGKHVWASEEETESQFIMNEVFQASSNCNLTSKKGYLGSGNQDRALSHAPGRVVSVTYWLTGRPTVLWMG
jgi:hypothetical protein